MCEIVKSSGLVPLREGGLHKLPAGKDLIIPVSPCSPPSCRGRASFSVSSELKRGTAVSKDLMPALVTLVPGVAKARRQAQSRKRSAL